MEDECNLTEHDFIQTTDGHDLPYVPTFDLLNISIRDREIEEQPPHLRIDILKEEVSSPTGTVGDRFEGNRSRSVDLIVRSQTDGNGMGDARSSVAGTNENMIVGSSSLIPRTANNDSGDPTYHVFFSHAREDRKWVVDVLNKLESHEYGFKCCFADRDFELGRSVFDNIGRSIQASAKTVIVLSPEFLSSDWCEYEIRMTLEADLSARKRILIPVMLRPCRVPDFIGRLTYIEVENEHFWERFISALKHTNDCEVDVSLSGNYISRSGASSLQLPFHHNLDKLAKISLRETCDCCSNFTCDIVPNEITGSISAENFREILEILKEQQFVKRHPFFTCPAFCFPLWTTIFIGGSLMLTYILMMVLIPAQQGGKSYIFFDFGLAGIVLLLIACTLCSIRCACGYHSAIHFTKALRRANEISLRYNLMVGYKIFGCIGCQCSKLNIIFYFYDWRLCIAHFREHLRSADEWNRNSDIPNVNAAEILPIANGDPDEDLVTETLAAHVPEYLELFGKKKLQLPVDERHVRRCECLCQFAESLEVKNDHRLVRAFGVKSRRPFKRIAEFFI